MQQVVRELGEQAVQRLASSMVGVVPVPGWVCPSSVTGLVIGSSGDINAIV